MTAPPSIFALNRVDGRTPAPPASAGRETGTLNTLANCNRSSACMPPARSCLSASTHGPSDSIHTATAAAASRHTRDAALRYRTVCATDCAKVDAAARRPPASSSPRSTSRSSSRACCGAITCTLHGVNPVMSRPRGQHGHGAHSPAASSTVHRPVGSWVRRHRIRGRLSSFRDAPRCEEFQCSRVHRASK